MKKTIIWLLVFLIVPSIYIFGYSEIEKDIIRILARQKSAWICAPALMPARAQRPGRAWIRARPRPSKSGFSKNRAICRPCSRWS